MTKRKRKQKPMKVPVLTRAVVARINRRLSQENESLRRARGARVSHDLGEWYVVDTAENCVVRHDVDLEALGREIGALKEWERLEEEE